MEDLALQYSPETRQAVKNWFEKYKSRQGTDIYNIAEAYLDSQLTNFGEMTFALDEEEYRAYSKHLLAEDGHSIDEYIRLNSKYSILFRSSTFITLGLETNIFKKILKKII